MQKLLVLLMLSVMLFKQSPAQTVKAICTEREKKEQDVPFPVIINTCYLKQIKFVKTSYPDAVGRYIEDDCSVYLKNGKKYLRCNNTDIFNSQQSKLLASINQSIQSDFQSLKADSSVNECLSNIDTIPVYTMNELQIYFYDGEIWFSIHWGLSGVCRAVDGTIIRYKLKDVVKYLK